MRRGLPVAMLVFVLSFSLFGSPVPGATAASIALSVKSSAAKSSGDEVHLLAKQAPKKIAMGTYTISTPGKMMLDSKNGTVHSGTNTQLWSKNGTVAQKWRLVAKGSYFSIRCPRSLRAVSIANGSTKNRANVRLEDYKGKSAQLWRALPSGDGWFYLRSKSGLFLSATGSGESRGENIRVVKAKIAAQKFRFTATKQVKSASELYKELGVVKDYRKEFVHGNKSYKYQKYIMLHDTEGDGEPRSVINYWDGNNQYVAAHFVIGKNGSVHQCVPLDKIAHHAGFGNIGHNKRFGVRSESRDDKRGTRSIGSAHPDYGMNSYSIGIELVHVGGRGGYPKAQLKALDKLIRYIDTYYGFESKIISHNEWRVSNSDMSKEFASYLKNYKKGRSYRA
jgi:hypothetical protein